MKKITTAESGLFSISVRFFFLCGEMVIYLIAFMTMATRAEAVGGWGRSPAEPAMSRWLYLRGAPDERECLVRPETCAKKLFETGGASFDFARVENQLYVVVLRAFC